MTVFHKLRLLWVILGSERNLYESPEQYGSCIKKLNMVGHVKLISAQRKDVSGKKRN